MNVKRTRRLAVVVTLGGLGLLGGLASPSGVFAAHTAGRSADVAHDHRHAGARPGLPSVLAR